MSLKTYIAARDIYTLLYRNAGIIDMIPGAADAIKAYKALVATEEFAKETNNKAISNGINNALSAIPGYSLVRTIGEWLF